MAFTLEIMPTPNGVVNYPNTCFMRPTLLRAILDAGPSRAVPFIERRLRRCYQPPEFTSWRSCCELIDHPTHHSVRMCLDQDDAEDWTARFNISSCSAYFEPTSGLDTIELTGDATKGKGTDLSGVRVERMV